MKLFLLISTLLVTVCDATEPDGSVGLCQVDCDTDIECKPGLWCADAHKPELRAAGFDERKVKCGNVGKWSEEVCFDPAVLRPSGGSGGDPHFRTYDGTKYDFHGQCDLVMARSPEFGEGLGLHLHARTEIVSGWSLISNAALNIGEDTLELANDSTLFLNGKTVDEFPIQLAGKYEVKKSIEKIGGESSSIEQVLVTVVLNYMENIQLSVFKNMVSVQVNAILKGTEGMLGMQSKDGLIGRDRQTIMDDGIQMGFEWQVGDQEPMLFREVRAPQYPETCILPKVESRRLQHSEESQRRAADACKDIGETYFDFCVQDVLLTGDIDIAKSYGRAF